MGSYQHRYLGSILQGLSKEPNRMHLRGREAAGFTPQLTLLVGGWLLTALNPYHFWAVLNAG